MSKQWLVFLLAVGGCSFSPGNWGEGDPSSPTILSSTPIDGTADVASDGRVSATFSEAMDPDSLNASTFTLTSGANAAPVKGTVVYANLIAVFWPDAPLVGESVFSAMITTEANGADGVALATTSSWSFTTGTVAPPGIPVNLGTAGDFVILTKGGITTVPTSNVIGDLGVSPAAASYITGFSLSADPSNKFSTSAQVTGKVYAADYAVPTPAKLITAVLDMESAYLAAAAREPDVLDLGAGAIGGMPILPGVYRWGSALAIPQSVTLVGRATDVWIFQVEGAVTMAANTTIIMSGGALPKNVFWQIEGSLTLGEMAHFEGVVLAQTYVTFGTGASINGRLLAQTAVTIAGSRIAQPSP